MPVPPLQRNPVWSARLRALHWLMALAVIVLAASGVLYAVAETGPAETARRVHVQAGYALAVLLAARLYLLFLGRGPERWRDFVPRGPQRREALVMLRFYISLGRTALPRYFGHNPLWGPLYLLLFAGLLAQLASGLSMTAGTVPANGAALWHVRGAWFVVAGSGLHVLSVMWQDWRGTTGEVSAMLSGYKIFLIDHPDPARGGGYPVSRLRPRD